MHLRQDEIQIDFYFEVLLLSRASDLGLRSDRLAINMPRFISLDCKGSFPI